MLTSPSAHRRAEILNPKGLHMRPATRFVQLAVQYQSEVRVACHGKDVDGKSILDMTFLAAECGVVLDIIARGADANAAVDALVALIADRFNMHDDGDNEHI